MPRTVHNKTPCLIDLDVDSHTRIDKVSVHAIHLEFEGMRHTGIIGVYPNGFPCIICVL